MSVPTPRVLDNRPAAATTAAALGAYHAELTSAALPPTLVADLVLAAGRTLIHTAGLTAPVPGPGGVPILVTLGAPAPAPANCRCARPRGEGK
ncbi:hypothetical protein AB0O31_03235 [Kitasatospora cineracea]|uniref:hypothetical protein n=1 Tax=Kitasatospora cineracea TaxID=88074 RepID=UPI003426DD01